MKVIEFNYLKNNGLNYIWVDGQFMHDPQYWNNFVNHLSNVFYKRGVPFFESFEIINDELSKFNAKFSYDKNSNYVKFKTSKDFTFFVLHWS